MHDTQVETAGKYSVKVKVMDPLGLHLRPAAQLVKLANQYHKCELHLSREDRTANAKSIMSVIMLSAETGSELTVNAYGEKAEEVIGAIAHFFESGFDNHACRCGVDC